MYLLAGFPPIFYCMICVDIYELYRKSQRQRQMYNRHFDALLDVVPE